MCVAKLFEGSQLSTGKKKNLLQLLYKSYLYRNVSLKVNKHADEKFVAHGNLTKLGMISAFFE